MIKLAYDLRWVRSEQIDGIGRYSLGLAKALRGEDLDIIFLYHQRSLKPFLESALGSDAKLIRVPFEILTVADFFRTPGFLRGLGIDVYFSPNYITSFWHRGYEVILMVHDLIPFLYRKYRGKVSLAQQLFYLSALPTEILLDQADMVIVNSQATKENLEKLLGVPAAKVTVLYPGLEVKPVGKPTKGSYLLYLGRMEPYKNLGRLIEAYSHLSRRVMSRYQLLIGGVGVEPYRSKLQQLTKDFSVGNRVKFLGFVPENKLGELYRSAAAFVYPSLYEGFGLPVLEARAAGVPVVTSNTSSLPEAAGDGALLVNPTNVDDLSHAMERVLTDEALRQKLIQADQHVVQEFSWASSAKKFKELIDDLAV